MWLSSNHKAASSSSVAADKLRLLAQKVVSDQPSFCRTLLRISSESRGFCTARASTTPPIIAAVRKIASFRSSPRIIATYHRGIPIPLVTSEVATNSRRIASPISRAIASTSQHALRTVSTRSVAPAKELSPSEVNEISRMRGLGICWQPGNVYHTGRTASGKSCLVQVDMQGKELAKFGSW